MIRKFLLALLVFIALFLTSCTYRVATPLCRHRAIYCAMVARDLWKVPVRIAYGWTELGQPHAQAQAFIDGKWRWIGPILIAIMCTEGHRIPVKVFNLFVVIGVHVLPWVMYFLSKVLKRG